MQKQKGIIEYLQNKIFIVRKLKNLNGGMIMHRWLKFFVGIVLFGLLIAAGGGYFLSRRGLPVYGENVMGSVKGEVMIYRDELGIPHISASNLEDLFYAQGYTQAQDRLWQMDVSRRAVAGRLSEIFGKDFIETDYFLRSLLMRYSAEAGAAALDPETRKLLESYTAGVNAFIAQKSGQLSLEFLLLGYAPEEWTVIDSLSIGKYMAWDLGGNMDTELLLAALMEALPRDKALDLFPSYPKDALTILSDSSEVDRHTPGGYLNLLRTVNSIRLGVPGQELGSNNWVVSGKMTESGKPLLANDMHLGMGIPSIWYQTRLEIPGELTASGVIFPGIPGIIVGTNGHIAWGVTNVGPDVQDLYMERAHPDNPYLFEYDGEWAEALVLPETFFVKGQEDPIQKEIIITQNGPLISEALKAMGGNEEIAGIVDPLSLRWTAHDVTKEVNAVLQFLTARTWEDFKDALENFHVPAQNFIFADLAGNIAYRANGRIPLRGKGEGLLPAPGWDRAYQWQGYIPYEELPTLYNPKEGYILTANHKVVPDSYPYFISHQWAPPYRAEAITENLQDKTGLTVSDMMEIQCNVANTQARLLMPLIKDSLLAASFTGVEQEALEVLLAWGENPHDEADSPGAAIYHTLYLKALEITFKEEMGEELFAQFSRGPVVNTFDRMLLEGSIWFDALENGRNGLLQAAFVSAVADLREKFKGAPESWEWGELHQILLSHNLSQAPVIGRLFTNGPYPMAGSHVTVAAASYRLGEPFMVRSSAPWRFIADLGSLEHNTWENLAGGVSGHLFSPYYRNQTQAWLEGSYSPIRLGTPEKAEVESGWVMEILPVN